MHGGARGSGKTGDVKKQTRENGEGRNGAQGEYGGRCERKDVVAKGKEEVRVVEKMNAGWVREEKAGLMKHKRGKERRGQVGGVGAGSPRRYVSCR